MFRHICTKLFVLTATVFSTGVLSQTGVVDLGYAQYQGVYNTGTNITSFLGIRYAAPPTGTLRWLPPQAPANISGVQLATTVPNICFQGLEGSSPTSPFPSNSKRAVTAGESEDCLFLNVHVSGKITQNSRMPVVVWIHGGGYTLGGADSSGDLVTDGNGGVISVSIQYRLGIFGFLSSAEVKANGVVNVGLLDQQFALQWVQSHIASFGGDPFKVTIWGVSAGAGSVLQHIVANGGQTYPPLFRAAMTSSTFLPQQYNYNDAIPEAMYSRAVELSGCTSSQDRMACFRTVDAATLSSANNVIANESFYGTFGFVPVVDGGFIVERPTETLHRGIVNGEVLLAMTNTFEGRIFVNPSTSNISSYVMNLFPTFRKEQVDAVVAQYIGIPGLSTALDQAIAVMGEAIFICPSYYLLGALEYRSFKGRYAVPPADHGGDIGLYFPSSQQGTRPDNSLRRPFSQSFLDVVKSMDPNIKFDPANITPDWSLWSDGATEMIFDITSTGGAAISPMQVDQGLIDRCDFWNMMAPYIPQ